MAAPWLAVVAESGCRYYSELQFPADLVVGLAVTRLGNSSVTYRTGLWAGGDTRPAAGLDTRPAAVGSWVHVYVDRRTRRPVPIPDAVRALLQTAVHDATPD